MCQGEMRLAAVNEGDQRRRQEATIPTYQLDVSLPTASGDPFPPTQERAVIICTQQVCSNIMKPELGPLGFGSCMSRREREVLFTRPCVPRKTIISLRPPAQGERNVKAKVSRLLAASVFLQKTWRPHRNEPVGHQEDSRPSPGWTGRGLPAPHQTLGAAGLTQRMCARTVC